MLSGAADPECRQRQPVILSGSVGAAGADVTTSSPIAVLTAADETPDLGGTKVLAHASIHLAVAGTAAAMRELAVTATQSRVGADGAVGWANSCAVH
jgi:hypothetical protein